MRLVALSGSLRARSTNNAVLHTALDLLDPVADSVRTPDIAALPHFNPDLDPEGATPPPAVAALRAAVAEADAVLIVSPEYAHGVPGSLKNALDWLVSGTELAGRPTAVLTGSPAPGGGAHAHAQLRETLRTMDGDIVDAACLAIGTIASKIDHATGRTADPATSQAVRGAMAALRAATAAGTGAAAAGRAG